MISADDLKTKGIACLEENLADKAQDFIAASEKQCFVVMTLEQYYYLREMEMQAALYQVKQNRSYGRCSNNAFDQYADNL
ncbi:MAG: type II toxin-antitoxin system Phd/YefM family antitoxin [Nitrosomonas sp.]|nr:MAG: type II toxin-antitoxin system Phd/YefM family antitoxin [Nitrosomonas sp.]